jgi:hypothetical protein
VIEDGFPEFYRRADADSARWQTRYLRCEKVQLASLLGAAAVAAFGSYPLPVVLLFALALLAQVYRLATRADEKWWNGRAGAESVKTAAWRFVVGAAPFGLSNPGADVELARRVAEVAREVADLVPVPGGETHVTPEMREVRARPLQKRIDIYQRERIQNQCSWYTTKSEFNQSRSTWWSLGGIAAPGLALILGIAAAVGDWEVDALGVFSAIGASVVAWVAVKQYQILARSYAVASAELGVIDVEISSRSWTEDEWAVFVNEAEEAISREHTSWRASRAV